MNPVQLTLLRNGNPVLTYTDTTENLFGGSPGIGVYSPSGDHLAIDDWGGAGNLAPDTEAPSTPENLVATALGVSQIGLSWTASTDNVGVTGYLVERQDPGSQSLWRWGQHRDELQRHGIGRGEQLQLSGPGDGCGGEPERVFRGGERDDPGGWCGQ